jgi:predicted O-linked N-acetylglucosamine transferase (SPINDLY family)
MLFAEHSVNDAMPLTPGIEGGETLTLGQLFATAEQLCKAGQSTVAVALYQDWLADDTQPLRHLAFFNLGSLLQSISDTTGALNAYRNCLALQPGFPQAVINLGLVQESLGQTDEALQTWSALPGQRLLQDQATDQMVTLALNHIGRVHENHKRYDLAERALHQSLLINPKQEAAIQHWVHIRQKACMWPVYRTLPGLSMNDLLMATSPLAMLALSDEPVQQLLTSHAFVGRTYSFNEEYLGPRQPWPHAKIRIGYVSGDLCVHAVGLLLAETLEAHDRERFEIYGYDFSAEDGSAHRMRLLKGFDHVRPIHGLTDREAAQLIVSDEIDVLIDLHGLSNGARPGIFALHPAPLQGTWLGFIGTTAMPWLDFVITDRQVHPDSESPYFSEKPLYVDGSFLPLCAPSAPPRHASREEFGLPVDAFVMASFGNVYKLHRELFDRWLSILRRAPCALLWLIDDNPIARNQLMDYAQRAGADISRIRFSARVHHAEYRAYLSVADLFLDTWPYNCGSTTNDVIGVGTPLLTVTGRSMVSRMGSSVLHALNAGAMVAHDLDHYEELAVALAHGEMKAPDIQLTPALAEQLNHRRVQSLENELVHRLSTLAANNTNPFEV